MREIELLRRSFLATWWSLPPGIAEAYRVGRATVLHNSLFSEDLYLRAYETPAELRVGLNRYFEFYNSRRRHRALDRRPPDAVYFHQAAGKLAA